MKFLFKTTILTVVLLFTILSAQAFRVVGYLPAYRFNAVNTIDYSKLTHVMVSFGNPDVNGVFSFSEDVTNLVTKAHAENCNVFISTGGGGLQKAIEDIYKNKTNEIDRPALISSLMGYVRSNNLDGIDVDLESSLVEMSTYNAFVQELVDSAHADGVEVSAAYARWTGGSVTKATLQKLDFINTMSYDATGPWQPNNAGQHAPMSQTKGDYSFWLNKGTVAENIVIGVPFYGYEFKSDKTVPAHTWCSIVSNYPNDLDDDQVTTADGTLYYNGKVTIASKTQYAIDNGGGIMIWELGQDCEGVNSLLDVIIDKMADNQIYVSTEEVAVFDVTIYPNPIKNIINIKGEFNGSVEIYNLIGKQVWSGNGAVRKVDLSNLISGIYIIQLKNNQGSIAKTIVKK